GFISSPLPGVKSSRPVADRPAGPKEESFLGRAAVAPRAAALPETLSAAEEQIRDAGQAQAAEPGAAMSSISGAEIAVTLWLAGSLLRLGWAIFHLAHFRRLLRHARQAPADLQGEANDLARRLGLRRCPAVWLVPGAVSPMVWAAGTAPCLV